MKTLRHKSDLAINGAPPAFDVPLHVGTPNVGDRKKFHTYCDEIFDRNQLTNNGPLVRKFEKQIAKYLNVKHCVATCNGTIALEIAIRALGMGGEADKQGEVIVPSYTFIATAHALHWQAITPVFADIDPQTHNLDPLSVQRLITPGTKGIIGVHLWGRAAPWRQLHDIARQHKLPLLFDASHAFGCSHEGKLIGSFGDAEVFSFHATKFFNSFEGGAVATNNDELAATMRLTRNFGFAAQDEVTHAGTNGKMTEICAAMGLVNLENIDDAIATNRRNYDYYQQALSSLSGIELIPFDRQKKNNFQYVVIQIGDNCEADRDHIYGALRAENILARKYFWPGCHRMKPYCDMWPDASGSLPNTEEISKRVIVLPAGKGIGSDEISFIAQVISMVIR